MFDLWFFRLGHSSSPPKKSWSKPKWFAKRKRLLFCLILERCDKGFSVLFLIHDAIIALGLAVACFMHKKNESSTNARTPTHHIHLNCQLKECDCEVCYLSPLSACSSFYCLLCDLSGCCRILRSTLRKPWYDKQWLCLCALLISDMATAATSFTWLPFTTLALIRPTRPDAARRVLALYHDRACIIRQAAGRFTERNIVFDK